MWIYIYGYIYGYIYIEIPDTRSARSCQVPDRARYQIVPGTIKNLPKSRTDNRFLICSDLRPEGSTTCFLPARTPASVFNFHPPRPRYPIPPTLPPCPESISLHITRCVKFWSAVFCSVMEPLENWYEAGRKGACPLAQ